MYQEGLARFATEQYSNDPVVLKNRYIHLTNFSINKRNVKNYVRNNNRSATRNDKQGEQDDEDPEQEESSKWSLKFLRRYLNKHMKEITNQNTSSEILFDYCKDVIIKTLISTEPNMTRELNRCGNR